METRRQSKRKEAASGGSSSRVSKRSRQSSTPRPQQEAAKSPPAATPRRGAGPSPPAAAARAKQPAPPPISLRDRANKPSRADTAPGPSTKGPRSPVGFSRFARAAGKEKVPSPGKSKAKQPVDRMDRPTSGGPRQRGSRSQREAEAEAQREDNSGSEDEMDDMTEETGRNLSSATTALQGLLKKLGAGFDDILPPGFGSSSGRLKNILATLKTEDPTMQLDALSQLCELLSISSEEALTTFPVDDFVPILVQLLNAEHSPDMMLFAARALTYLADLLPSSCNAIVGYNAVPAFCTRLLNIEYIDLAEQSLQALGKIASEHPSACLEAGGMCAVLSFLDFFPTSMQHIAVVTAANMAHGAGPSCMDQVKDAVPILTNLLQHHDPKVVDNSCLALSRLAEALAKSPSNLEDVCSKSLVEQILQLVTLTETGAMTTNLNVSTYFGLVKLLATCAAALPMVAETLLLSGISTTLRRLFASSAMLSSSSLGSSSMLKSVDQLSLVLALSSSLLPSVPDASAVAIADPPVNILDSSLNPRASSKTDGDETRIIFLTAHPEIMQTLGTDLMDQLLQIYGGTVAASVRTHCLGTITKLLHYSTAEVLNVVLLDLPISHFIAGLLGGRQPATMANALQMAEILMVKMPDVLSPFFLKEGVVHAIEQLAAEAPAPQPARMQTRSITFRNRQEEANSDEPDGDGDGAKTASDPSPAKLRKAVHAWAARFRKTRFTDAGISSDNLDTAGIQEMRAACSALEAGEQGAAATLLRLLECPEKRITTFEFLTSGAVEVLQRYMTGAGGPGANEMSLEFLSRLAAFIAEALPKGSGEAPPLRALVAKLHECLASTETFPVLMSNVSVSTSSSSISSYAYGSYRHRHRRSSSSDGGGAASGGGGSSLSQGLAALCQPFKLRLCRESDDSSVRDYSGNVVLIEPLATMRAIEDFLWQRVQMADVEGSLRDLRRGHRSSSAANGASGSGGREAEGDPSARSASRPVPKGPAGTERMTRSAAARASANAAAAAEEEQQAAEEAEEDNDEDQEEPLFGSEDDEELDDEMDEEDGLMLEEDEDYEDDDLDELGMSMGGMRVHDVSKAGGSGSGSGGRDAAGGSSAGAGEARRGAGGSSGAAAGNASGGSGHEAKLVFKMNGVVLEPTATIFQAILQSRQAAALQEAAEAGEDTPPTSQRLWDKVHSIHYSKPVGNAQAKAEAEDGKADTADGQQKQPSAPVGTEGALLELLKQPPLEDMPVDDATSAVLCVLRLIEALNLHRFRLSSYLDKGGSSSSAGTLAAGHIPRSAFVSRKLAPKLAQQLQDVLAICGSGLPAWCNTLVRHAPFLFPFEMRRRYFHCTALGLSRALQHLQAAQAAESGAGGPGGSGGGGGSGDGREMRLARLQRQKVRVNRPRILESAVKVMELYASHRAVLEVEYVGEVGTGLGPTLEFYTLLSHELQRRGLGMWREGDAQQQPAAAKEAPAEGEKGAAKASEPSGEPMIVAPHGLFPAPILDDGSPASARTADRFKLLGRMMAKALQDSRLIDLPLSPCFFRAALGRPLDLYDVAAFDPQLAASLLKLSRAVAARDSPNGPVIVDGVPIEDLCLQFTVPGQEDCELQPGGCDKAVTSENAKEYLETVADALLGSGIKMQMEAFREGFNEVFPLRHLEYFYEDELETMLCGSDDPWDSEMLLKAIKFDHGYSADSAPVRHFVEVLCGLSPEDRRAFLRFVTGSPRLPPGGLGALQPQLTVVRKHPSGGDGQTPGTTPGTPGMRLEGTTLADNDLVSVMTCANYVKLPPYSCKDVLADRLMYVIREGQCSFDLS